MDLAGRSMKAQMKLAERDNAAFVAVTGETELAQNTISLKEFATREQKSIPRSDLIATLKARLSSS